MDIMSICDSVTSVLESVRVPATILPAPLLYGGCMARPGVSPMLVTSNIISRQTEAGAPYGPNEDGSKNIAEAMEAIRIDEIMKAIHFDGQVQIAIPPGAIQFMGTGTCPTGPVTVTGFNVNFVSGVGTFI